MSPGNHKGIILLIFALILFYGNLVSCFEVVESGTLLDEQTTKPFSIENLVHNYFSKRIRRTSKKFDYPPSNSKIELPTYEDACEIYCEVQNNPEEHTHKKPFETKAASVETDLKSQGPFFEVSLGITSNSVEEKKECDKIYHARGCALTSRAQDDGSVIVENIDGLQILDAMNSHIRDKKGAVRYSHTSTTTSDETVMS
jgi:hypothetical protein